MTRSVLGRVAAGVAALAALAAVTGCGGSGADGPIVGEIDAAVAAVEDHYGAPQEYLEISATESLVSLIVDTPSGPEQAFWDPDDGLADPVPIGAPARPVFTAEQIAVDAGGVFDQIRDELPDADIVDFAITATPDGGVVYDARLRSSQGGALLVLLSADGRILGVQAE